MDRRTTLKLLAIAPLPAVAGCTWTADDAERAREGADAARAAGDGTLQSFSEDEYETASVLADLILPADERSGSATDLGVPAFLDFMLADVPALKVPILGGLAWLDAHTRRRFGHTFREALDEERRSVLDEIAYPDKADPALRHGVVFFGRFRDLTASGFWTTKEGMADLGYVGNRAVAEWKGAPQAEMDRLGLTFDAWETA